MVPESVMLTGSSRGAGNEANYVMQGSRVLSGTNNIDNCARTCHAASVIGAHGSRRIGCHEREHPHVGGDGLHLAVRLQPGGQHPIVARRIVNAKERRADLIDITRSARHRVGASRICTCR